MITLTEYIPISSNTFLVPRIEFCESSLLAFRDERESHQLLFAFVASIRDPNPRRTDDSAEYSAVLAIASGIDQTETHIVLRANPYQFGTPIHGMRGRKADAIKLVWTAVPQSVWRGPGTKIGAKAFRAILRDISDQCLSDGCVVTRSSSDTHFCRRCAEALAREQAKRDAAELEGWQDRFFDLHELGPSVIQQWEDESQHHRIDNPLWQYKSLDELDEEDFEERHG